MVTLQILVLSFLVRIQVAQLQRLSFEGRFFISTDVLWQAYKAYDDEVRLIVKSENGKLKSEK